MAIFIAFKIDIKIACSSKANGNIKLYFFSKNANVTKKVTKFIFLKKIIFMFLEVS